MNARVKLQKAAAVDDWRSLLAAPSPSIADLERTIASLHADAQAADATICRARDARRAILLAGSDDELKAHDEAAGAASRTIERSRAAIEELEVKLAEAQAAAEDRARRAAYDRAVEMVTTARERLQAEYPAAVTTIRRLLRALAEAETARLSANAALPIGAERIASAEDFRSAASVPAEVVSRRRVMLWIDPRTDAPFNDRDQDVVGKDCQGAGRLDPPMRPQNLRQRAFDRVVYYPEQQAPGLPNLSTAIDLPALYPGEPSGYQPPLPSDPVTAANWQLLILAALEMYEAPARAIPRTPVHELVAVDI